MSRPPALLLLFLFVVCATAHGEDARVKRIAIYVEPYYAASRDPEGTPRVEVASKLDRLLADLRTRKAITLSLESLEKRDVPSAIRSIYNYPQDKNVGIRIALGNALERYESGDNIRAIEVLQEIYADHIQDT